jgi:hypothetical protein
VTWFRIGGGVGWLVGGGTSQGCLRMLGTPLLWLCWRGIWVDG